MRTNMSTESARAAYRLGYGRGAAVARLTVGELIQTGLGIPAVSGALCAHWREGFWDAVHDARIRVTGVAA